MKKSLLYSLPVFLAPLLLTQPIEAWKEETKTSIQTIAGRYYYPLNCGWLNSVSVLGDSIEFGDGSIWGISSLDTHIISTWGIGDPLVVSPNYQWLSYFRYYITNKKTGTYVQANLTLGPIPFGPFSHWIMGVDLVSSLLYLENGTIWRLSSEDLSTYYNWSQNDTIIIGGNTSWGASFDHILINVNMNNFVRAKQY